ncbi:MAG: methyltransferase, partial [Victivallales bacterium]|nr:methyltransferase [Victivallales bacterium]
MIVPELVARSFSRFPEYYDANAAMQRCMAAKLADSIDAALDDDAPRSVLEIGCGTGFLTRRLFKAFPSAEFAVTDISPAMVAYCERSTAELAADLGVVAEFAVFDASVDAPRREFDLIASSLAFQWVEDFSGMIDRLSFALAPGGHLAFATLADGTFVSVSAIFAEYGLELPVPSLPTALEIENALPNFALREFRVETISEEFDSLL